MATYAIKYRLTIGAVSFSSEKNNFLSEATVESSFDLLCDTASFTFGNVGKQLRTLFAVGDRVRFECWYEGFAENVVFEGQVVKTSPKVPFVVECKDEGFVLENTQAPNKTYTNTSLKTIISDVLSAASIAPHFAESFPTVSMQSYAVADATCAEVINDLIQQFSFVAYFREGKLLLGARYLTEQGETKFFNLQRNVAASNLEFISEQERKVQVVARSYNSQNNTKIEVKFGQEGGETRTLNFVDIANETELRKIAESEAKKLVYSGYEGDFDAFFLPFVRHSDIVNIQDSEFPERAGNYIVSQVVYNIGNSGARQKVSPSLKI